MGTRRFFRGKHLLCALAFLGIVTGCNPQSLLDLSSSLGKASSDLGLVGNALSPLEYTDLTGVLDQATPVEWADGTVVLSDESQPQVAAFYQSKLAPDVIPGWYLNERLYRLQAPPTGQAVRIGFLSGVMDSAYLYDDQHRELASLPARDFDGRLRTVDLPSAQTSALYVRLNLAHLLSTGEPLVRLSSVPGDTSAAPRQQIVVLHMSGCTGLTFRTGILTPTNVSAVEDPVVRQAIVQAFTGIYAPYNMIVRTDADDEPAAPHSVIHIGSADPPLGENGISEWVDGLNQAMDDVALVDLGSGQLPLAALFGSEDFGKAIGLVAAHEMGHLLGLSHTLDPDDLMCDAKRGVGLDFQRLLARNFRRAPLDSYFVAQGEPQAIGEQDPELYLMSVLGPAPQ